MQFLAHPVHSPYTDSKTLKLQLACSFWVTLYAGYVVIEPIEREHDTVHTARGSAFPRVM